MSKEVLKNLIDLIDEKNIDEIYQLLIKFIPEDQPFPDEIEAISRGEKRNGSWRSGKFGRYSVGVKKQKENPENK